MWGGKSKRREGIRKSAEKPLGREEEGKDWGRRGWEYGPCGMGDRIGRKEPPVGVPDGVDSGLRL